MQLASHARPSCLTLQIHSLLLPKVLDDSVRSVLCPDKLSAREWLEVMEASHNEGLRTTATLMFGSVESPAAWAAHLVALRDLQVNSDEKISEIRL